MLFHRGLRVTNTDQTYLGRTTALLMVLVVKRTRRYVSWFGSRAGKLTISDDLALTLSCSEPDLFQCFGSRCLVWDRSSGREQCIFLAQVLADISLSERSHASWLEPSRFCSRSCRHTEALFVHQLRTRVTKFPKDEPTGCRSSIEQERPDAVDSPHSIFQCAP